MSATTRTSVRGIAAAVATALVGGLGFGALTLLNRPAPVMKPAPIVAGDQPGPTDTPAPAPESQPVPPVAEDGTQTPAPSPTDQPAPLPSVVGGEAIAAALIPLLPDGLTATVDTDPIASDVASVTLTDAKGEAYAQIALWATDETVPGSTATPVDGGQLIFFDGALDGKRGIDHSYSFVRADGATVYLHMDNVRWTGEKSWMTSRDSLPIDATQAATILSDPSWGPLLDKIKAAR